VSADGVPDEALLNRMASEFFALVPVLLRRLRNSCRDCRT
jgi:hypothetical protein